MIDKQLFNLIGENKKYIFITVALMLLGTVANITITASICWALYLATINAKGTLFLYPALTALLGIFTRYFTTITVGNLKDTLGRKVKKDLRQRTYNKIVTLGERGADGLSMAGLIQVSMEGIEQLDLYYSSYLPQFLFSLISPLILFAISFKINWQMALV